ncbi:hypothetical protein AAG906_003905 [Vitis piasezkii]
MSLLNGGSHKQNQHKWVRDILKINDVVREMEAPSKKKEIDAFKLENRIKTLMTCYMDEIEPLFPQVVIAKSFSGIDVERHGQIMPTPKRIYDLVVDFAIREILQHIECPKIWKIRFREAMEKQLFRNCGANYMNVVYLIMSLMLMCQDVPPLKRLDFQLSGSCFPPHREKKLDETRKAQTSSSFFMRLVKG